uniref:Uncharacterized protein n=1 Tax=Vespula pensylvanica TaxID=30213 RepID=A0A834UFR3_VESPE|nr:hypothetical protein H0235_003901 [Vespula pensylvanica]
MAKMLMFNVGILTEELKNTEKLRHKSPQGLLAECLICRTIPDEQRNYFGLSSRSRYRSHTPTDLISPSCRFPPPPPRSLPRPIAALSNPPPLPLIPRHPSALPPRSRFFPVLLLKKTLKNGEDDDCDSDKMNNASKEKEENSGIRRGQQRRR